ncbi:hypothetical protein BDZ91DRAFT_18708 [Kalaharituber pfeilii]|nr:hypothetical protein BDZ91DRAFT_18708 [Kalaharituber pfeilii]
MRWWAIPIIILKSVLYITLILYADMKKVPEVTNKVKYATARENMGRDESYLFRRVQNLHQNNPPSPTPPSTPFFLRLKSRNLFLLIYYSLCLRIVTLFIGFPGPCP